MTAKKVVAVNDGRWHGTMALNMTHTVQSYSMRATRRDLWARHAPRRVAPQPVAAHGAASSVPSHVVYDVL